MATKTPKIVKKTPTPKQWSSPHSHLSFLWRVHQSNFRHQSRIWVGVYLDSWLSFDKQLSETCKASYFHIRALCNIRSSFTTEAAKSAETVASPWLLQCSPRWHTCLPSGPPPAFKLFRIPLHSLWPKSIALIILTSVLSELCSVWVWLPVWHRINFKIAIITH